MKIQAKVGLFLFVMIAIIFSNPASSSYAQEQPQAEKLVKAIEVVGNRSISRTTILSKMKTQIGSVFSENIVNDDLKRLYLLGYFSDIDITTEDYRDGIKIIITVVERPLIKKINFIGFLHLYTKEEKLRELVKTRVGQYLDYPTLNEDISILKDNYVKKGFSEVSIEYKIDIDQETNQATVDFISKEGRRIKIRRIYVEGNKHFKDSRILKIIKTKRAWLFGAGILKEEVLGEDMERIRSFYQKQGFSDVKADYKIKEHPRKPYLDIAIAIQEGKQYFVGLVHLDGNVSIASDEIKNSLEFCLPEKVYSPDGLDEDKFIIQGLYFDRGYIMANVDAVSVVNPETGKVDITYYITENEIVYVNKIKIKGNIKTKDIVIRRELRIYPGDKFDGMKLRRSKERLVNLGFFEEIGYDTQSTDIDNQQDLIVEVKEAKTGTFSFGGGYSTIDNFIGFIEIEQRNFDWNNFPYFTGDGQDLKVRAEIGSVTENFILSFTEPWLYDYPISFGFDAYMTSHDRESDVGWGYDEKRTGGDLRLGKEISEYIRGNVAYRFEQIKINDVDPTASTELEKEKGTNNISKIELGMAFDNRDNIFNPTRGILLTGNLDVAGGAFGGDKDFYKFHTRGSKYFLLWRKSVLELKARLGLADSYSNSEDIPIYERFFAGGAYSIRGYEERSIGPIDSASKDPLGGNSLFIGNIELTYPLLDFIRLAAFYDIGNVWKKLSDIGSGGFRSGFGFGVRIKTPIGPIRLDYGIPLDKQPGEDEKKSGRVHFSMGSGF